MGKKFIHVKYLKSLELEIEKSGIFVVEPDCILTPYAVDFLDEKGVKIVYGDCKKDEEESNLRIRIQEILKAEYGIECENVIEKILDKIR